ncbi:hypothetical protein SARC_01679 [Sphaeroforma arctica JP610]|uniref:Uncharacterized protein n=1 Tax=Sphaeroforma arctica JP610 TaxID=667725 RepID=A0A0L0GD42_9EUKA|nr:hypothetical protein SARC_01679 [Sphaeroforma arctica JP610]KNC86153.1 hypothetical protein SARC_01679 [Sphaeroforma arctica JP610]|eukprot:XP_014160055.1 hypothetical protein SARC_01679 [Sphaeroforma arctica JP610]
MSSPFTPHPLNLPVELNPGIQRLALALALEANHSNTTAEHVSNKHVGSIWNCEKPTIDENSSCDVGPMGAFIYNYMMKYGTDSSLESQTSLEFKKSV